MLATDFGWPLTSPGSSPPPADIDLAIDGGEFLEDAVAGKDLPFRAEGMIQPHDSEVRADGQRQRGAEAGGVEAVALRGVVAVGLVLAPESIHQRVQSEAARIAGRIALRAAPAGGGEIVIDDVAGGVAEAQDA